MFDAVQRILSGEARIAFGLVHGSVARGSDHAGSDLDVAIGVSSRMSTRELGDLIGKLESATGRTVDLVVVDEAPPALAYRIFRDGTVVFERDRKARVLCQARAVLDYLDFKPIEELCTKGVLAAAARGLPVTSP